MLAVAVSTRAGREVGSTFVTVEHDCNSEQDKMISIHEKSCVYGHLDEEHRMRARYKDEEVVEMVCLSSRLRLNEYANAPSPRQTLKRLHTSHHRTLQLGMEIMNLKTLLAMDHVYSAAFASSLSL